MLLNLPVPLLDQVDLAVQEQGVSRTQFLRQAVERNLRHYKDVERAVFVRMYQMGMSGVVTLSQTKRNLPTTANIDAMDFRDLACWLIVQIGPISLNVTTPQKVHVTQARGLPQIR